MSSARTVIKIGQSISLGASLSFKIPPDEEDFKEQVTVTFWGTGMAAESLL
jgi:hypothetical protein